jgi:hypothetical protein
MRRNVVRPQYQCRGKMQRSLIRAPARHGLGADEQFAISSITACGKQRLDTRIVAGGNECKPALQPRGIHSGDYVPRGAPIVRGRPFTHCRAGQHDTSP